MLSEKSRAIIGALQCGRIYKDAEILLNIPSCIPTSTSFNVAASIKMRKSECSGGLTGRPRHLQCGRIYKDAEI